MLGQGVVSKAFDDDVPQEVRPSLFRRIFGGVFSWFYTAKAPIPDEDEIIDVSPIEVVPHEVSRDEEEEDSDYDYSGAVHESEESSELGSVDLENDDSDDDDDDEEETFDVGFTPEHYSQHEDLPSRILERIKKNQMNSNFPDPSSQNNIQEAEKQERESSVSYVQRIIELISTSYSGDSDEDEDSLSSEMRWAGPEYPNGQLHSRQTQSVIYP